MKEKLTGTLYVGCEEKAIDSVVKEIRRLHPEARGGKVMKGFRAHNAEIIMTLKVSDQKELSALGKSLFAAMRGIRAIQPTIEVSGTATG
ncbi:MAG: hypothetical protein KGH65_00435 [Candidatus Micrarchaeota archaeon]|nr:hypothetical protein [Candidatus Micrarchaeota archaeon]